MTNKLIIVIIIIIVLVGGGIYFAKYGTNLPNGQSLLVADASYDAKNVGMEELAILNQVKNVKIDLSIFDAKKTPSYQNLHDHTVIITGPDIGRADPFAPIGGIVSPLAPAGR